jgi:hypothetical protein
MPFSLLTLGVLPRPDLSSSSVSRPDLLPHVLVRSIIDLAHLQPAIIGTVSTELLKPQL